MYSWDIFNSERNFLSRGALASIGWWWGEVWCCSRRQVFEFSFSECCLMEVSYIHSLRISDIESAMWPPYRYCSAFGGQSHPLKCWTPVFLATCSVNPLWYMPCLCSTKQSFNFTFKNCRLGYYLWGETFQFSSEEGLIQRGCDNWGRQLDDSFALREVTNHAGLGLFAISHLLSTQIHFQKRNSRTGCLD